MNRKKTGFKSLRETYEEKPLEEKQKDQDQYAQYLLELHQDMASHNIKAWV